MSSVCLDVCSICLKCKIHNICYSYLKKKIDYGLDSAMCCCGGTTRTKHWILCLFFFVFIMDDALELDNHNRMWVGRVLCSIIIIGVCLRLNVLVLNAVSYKNGKLAIGRGMDGRVILYIRVLCDERAEDGQHGMEKIYICYYLGVILELYICISK